VQLHEGDEAVHLGLGGKQLGEDPAEAERFRDQLRADPVVAGGGRVALVEDQIDDLEHRGETLGELVTAGASNGTRAAESVRFARTIRCWTVASGIR
jgi:hypothetical protein